MRRSSLSIVLIATFLLCLPAIADAQEEKEQTRFVYATYHECDASKQGIVDEIVNQIWAPAYDAAVETGKISSWGWLAHHTGGKWRRLFYYSAPTLDALMGAPDTFTPEVTKAYPAASQVLGEVCPSHEDYIWKVATGSAGAGIISQDRGKVGMSVYFSCDMSKEDRADEIVEEYFAPIYNKHVENGDVSSWGWLKHYLGGKYRRAATLTAPDIKSLLAGRDAILAAVNAKAEAASNEFGEICGSHQDYIWNILHETP